MADPESKNAADLAVQSLPDNLLEKIGSVDFEYPNDEDPKQTTMDEDMESRLRVFLLNFLSLDPFDFIILQQRVVYRRTCREIGRYPLLSSRMGIIASCHRMSRKFSMFKSALLAGFDDKGQEGGLSDDKKLD
jgi:hypothetical protein